LYHQTKKTISGGKVVSNTWEEELVKHGVVLDQKQVDDVERQLEKEFNG
jgi:hypothetical protein